MIVQPLKSFLFAIYKMLHGVNNILSSKRCIIIQILSILVIYTWIYLYESSYNPVSILCQGKLIIIITFFCLLTVRIIDIDASIFVIGYHLFDEIHFLTYFSVNLLLQLFQKWTLHITIGQERLMYIVYYK